MISLSKEVLRAQLSDKLFWKGLNALKEQFEQGDRKALFGAIAHCAQFQAVMPDWVTDELLRETNRLHHGESWDLNAFFGIKLSKTEIKALEKQKKLKEIEPRIVSAIAKHRWDGGTFNAEECFGAVAEQEGVSRRDVEAIYKKNKPMFEKLTRDAQHPEGCMNAIFPSPKRTGRPTLTEEDTWDVTELS